MLCLGTRIYNFQLGSHAMSYVDHSTPPWRLCDAAGLYKGLLFFFRLCAISYTHLQPTSLPHFSRPESHLPFSEASFSLVPSNSLLQPRIGVALLPLPRAFDALYSTHSDPPCFHLRTVPYPSPQISLQPVGSLRAPTCIVAHSCNFFISFCPSPLALKPQN